MNTTKYKNVIPGFKDLSAQEVFDICFNHVKKTKKQCLVGSACSYESFGCAASPLLTEEARKKLTGAWELLQENGKVPSEHLSLIVGIQRAHDYWSPHIGGKPFYDYFVDKMKLVAASYNLEMREP